MTSGVEPVQGQVWRGISDPTRTVEILRVEKTWGNPLDVRYRVISAGSRRRDTSGRVGMCFLPQFLSRYEQVTT